MEVCEKDDRSGMEWCVGSVCVCVWGGAGVPIDE